MKMGEKGFTFIELLVALSIIVLVGGAANIVTFQVLKGTERNDTHVTAIRQVQNAGYWLCRDARMAQSVNTDNLTLPDFLAFSWTEWDSDYEETYHSATYSFEGLADGIGDLKRTHWSSAGANEETLIASHIYYSPADPADTSKAAYQAPLLTLQLTAVVGGEMEIREYRIQHRPNI